MSTTTTTSSTSSSAAFNMLLSLVLDTGERFGQVATDEQLDDMRAILDPGDGPRRFALLESRGYGKSTLLAGISLSLLCTEMPAAARGYVYAVDGDQAQLLGDALAGFVERSGLSGLVDVGARTFTNRMTGAVISIESSDGASAFGKRAWLSILDEFTMLPSTVNHRRLVSSILSDPAKVKGSRLVLIGTGGSPAGLGKELWDLATSSPEHWYTAVRPGPPPWWSPSEVDATRASLTDSDWRRLILCEFAEGADSLTSPEDIDAVTRPGTAALPPVPGTRYVAALDVGTRRDLTALAVGHVEHRGGGRVTVIDRVLYWTPQKGERVDLAEVEETVRRICKEYRVEHLAFDRAQAEMLSQNLQRDGITVREYVFSTSGANRLARALHNAIRDRAIELPDDPVVREQFITTQLVETSPGTVKLINREAGSHDDLPVVCGMLTVRLSEGADSSGSGISGAAGRRLPAHRTKSLVSGLNNTLPTTTSGGRRHVGMSANGTPSRWLLGKARSSSPRGLPGGPIVGVPGDYRDTTPPREKGGA